MVKIIICIPFNQMDNYHWKRYEDQFKAILQNCDGLFIPVVRGYYPEDYEDLNVNMVIYKDLSTVEPSYKLPSLPMRILLPFYHLYVYNKFAKICSVYPYDIVLGYSGSGGMEWFQTLLGKYRGVPVVHRMRGYGKRERQYLKSLSSNIIGEYLDDYAWRKYDRHIPINREFYTIIRDFGVSENKVSSPIALGVDTDMFYPKSYPNKMTIGYIGRLSKEKNTEFLVKLMEATPDLDYIVVGKKLGPFEPPDNCTYYGPVLKDRINDYYNKVNAVILPSLTEGVSNIIYEAYATGRLLVCSNYAIPPEFPIYGKILDLNIDDWVNYLYSLTPEYCYEVGQKAIQWARENTWDIFGKRITEECRKLMK